MNDTSDIGLEAGVSPHTHTPSHTLVSETQTRRNDPQDTDSSVTDGCSGLDGNNSYNNSLITSVEMQKISTESTLEEKMHL